jgi:hypothetical protein
MKKRIKEQIIFALEDDSEVMNAALAPDSDLDEEDKQMNRELIREHERIIIKVENGEELTRYDLDLIRDANEIHLNDGGNLQEHHREAAILDKWLQRQRNKTKQKLGFDKQGRCKTCGSEVSFADVTDTLVFVGGEIVKRYDGDITNRNCVKCTYPKQYPDYADYDKGR